MNKSKQKKKGKYNPVISDIKQQLKPTKRDLNVNRLPMMFYDIPVNLVLNNIAR